MKLIIRQILSKIRLLEPAYRLHERVAPSARARAAGVRQKTDRLFAGHPNGFTPALRDISKICTALIMGGARVETALMQAPQIVAAGLAGYDVRVVLPTPSPALESVYRKFGVSSFVYLTESIHSGTHSAVKPLMDHIVKNSDLYDMEYRGIPAGKFALSTLMRKTRRGHLDIRDEEMRDAVRQCLSNSFHHIDGAIRIMEYIKPDAVFFIDRGYTPDGEMFEAALQSGASATTMNTAHRSGRMIFKRYNLSNKGQHPASLSQESWRRILAMPFSEKHWGMVYDELRNAYESGQWYDEVGTQFGKKIAEKAEIIQQLGLDPSKKTGVLYAHMFWDATFFWGKDLFQDYEEWFIESLKVMAKNDHLNWIVKLHPANAVKDARDGYSGDHVEYDAIRRAVGELPDHIKVLAPDAPISTFSLFQATDYCLTVRGTVGIEAACFGIPVITAGTGRYDGLGFTTDHDSVGSYLATLGTLETFPPMDEASLELARRYAWGLLFARPLKYESTQFTYEHDSKATIQINLSQNAFSSPADMPDIQSLKTWIIEASEDLLTMEPLSEEEKGGAWVAKR